VLRLLDAPLAMAVVLVVILAAGLAAMAQDAGGNWTAAALWQQRAVFVQQIETAFLLGAPWLVMRATPGWVERLRIIVDVPGQVFNLHKAAIASLWVLRAWLLVAIAVALLALVRVIVPDTAGPNAERTLTGAAQLPLEIVFVLIALWRMIWLGRLSAQPLKLDLFNPAPTFPFGWLSFAYAAVLSLRIALRFVLVGSAHPLMATAFGVFAAASLLMLVLPITGVFLQNTRLKFAALARIDAQVRALMQPLAGPTLDLPDVVQVNQRLDAWAALRKRIDAAWAWPVPNATSAVQAVGVSLTPVLLPALKQYALPLVQQLLGG
jgi:hypothetical protein